MAEIITVPYQYECPIDNYLDGTETELIDEVYEGESELWLVVNEETGAFETVLRDFEKNDGRPCPRGFQFVRLDCRENPLVAEVLSDYHANHKDDDDFVFTPGTRTIPTPEGFEEFEYEYPIHPDELYNDLKSVFNWNTKKVELYKNTNADIIGDDSADWDVIRENRNEFLMNSDAAYLAMKSYDPEKAEELEEYRQKLRDLPEALADIDPIFVDSCWPTTDLIKK